MGGMVQFHVKRAAVVGVITAIGAGAGYYATNGDPHFTALAGTIAAAASAALLYNAGQTNPPAQAGA